MFDIGGGELVVLLLVALFVFGPDRLPTMARQAGRWVRDLRRMVAAARREISDELGMDELPDLNPRRYVRRHVLDGLDLDDEPGRRTNGGRPSTDRKQRAAGRTASGSRTGAEAHDPAPPYDPDAT